MLGGTSVAECAVAPAAAAADQAAARLFSTAATAEDDLASFHELIRADVVAYTERVQQLPSGTIPSGTLLAATRGSFFRRLDCMRPARYTLRSLYDADLLADPLVAGRRCRHALCGAGNCGLHVNDDVVLAHEAHSLVAHGLSVLASEDALAANGAASPSHASLPRSRRVDFFESAKHGSAAGHLLGLRIAERLRRIAARQFDLPEASVRLSEHFLTLRQPGPSIEKTVHMPVHMHSHISHPIDTRLRVGAPGTCAHPHAHAYP